MIQRLGSDVISELRSGVTLSSLAQCVEELVLNSIDAGSNSVTVDVDISTVSVQVSDNGTGIRQNNLRNVGQRYFTSKCHSLKDLESATSYGFRGEALASLCKICQKVEIVSRHKSSSRTFCKLVRTGQDMGVYESTELRPKHGTTIKAHGVFYTLPVRQKLISEKVNLEQIRTQVLSVALINLDVSFLVRNMENCTTLLQIHSCSSVVSVISQIFGWEKRKTFKPIVQTTGVYTITGYVSLEGLPNKNFQFFYVNKRLVLKTRFHTLANHILARAITGLNMADPNQVNHEEELYAPKKFDKYAGFVINLESPYNSYDITFDPDKTLVEFQNWNEPISCLKECLSGFLKREGIFDKVFFDIQSDSQESSGSSQELGIVQPDPEVNIEYPCSIMKRPIKANDLRRSLYSSTAKRKRESESRSCTSGMSCFGNNFDVQHTSNSSHGSGGEKLNEKKRTKSADECQDSTFGSNKLSTNVTTSNITLTSANDEPHLKDPEWLCKCNPSGSQPVYVNLRTGNTSVTHPKPEPMTPLHENFNNSTESTNTSKLRPFRKFASHLSHNFAPWLPRSVSLRKSLSSGDANESSEIGDMLDQWVNPVFKQNEKLVTDVSFTDSSKTKMKLHSAVEPLKFTKDCFSKMKLINQVDNKFILCYYKGNGGDFLVAVDQHAAHERIRLETFTKDLYINSQTFGDKVALKCSPLPIPCKLSMSDHDIHVMQAFRGQLQQVGITFEDASSSDAQSSVRIKTVPSVFLAREVSDDGEVLRNEIKDCIEDLIKEQIEVTLSTRGAPTRALPRAITKALNSQACHGAIRFGDSLSIEECENLMTSLSTCDLPFQCAHGRPSIIPLINTTAAQSQLSQKETNLPQISRIRKQMQ